MPITEEIFAAFLKCDTKAYLQYSGTLGTQSEFNQRAQNQREEYKESCRDLLCAALHTPWFVGTPDLPSLKGRCYHLVLDYVVAQSDINVRLDALVLSRVKRARLDCPYIPVRFVPSEKLSTDDKLMLALDAVAFSKVYGKTPRAGRIIHGRNHTMATITLSPLLGRIQRVLRAINDQQTKAAEPLLAIKKHCVECEFQARCRQIAMQKDDLSLLTTLSAKERTRHNEKGIFTVLQFSYTFRSPRRSASMPPKHQPALKALAIRKNQIHILGTPAFSLPSTPIYVDVEGDPDRDFYYLIGLRVVSGSQRLRYSYWADTQDDEREMWAMCLRTVGELTSPRLIHYGAYETQFLKRMRARYPNVGSASQLDELTSSAQNLLSFIYPHVYFPTYTNSLKDVAAYLGFRWSSDSPSGLAALGWRLQWEASHEMNLKDRLIVYNAEDCEAAESVAEVLAAVSSQESASGASFPTVKADALKREFPQRFGEVKFVLPEFRQINEAAYWDYQRSKVYVRSNNRLRRQTCKPANRQSMRNVPVNKLVVMNEERLAACPHCTSCLIYRIGRTSQKVYDLKFSPAGVKRWVVKYSHRRFICWKCKATFRLHTRKHKYGEGLCAYLLYQFIELQIPQNAVAKSVKELFKLPLSRGSINWLKASEASRLEPAYQSILL
jgi:predicted RecB family nuclease